MTDLEAENFYFNNTTEEHFTGHVRDTNITYEMLIAMNQNSVVYNSVYGSMLLIGLVGNLIFLKSLITSTDGRSRLRPFLLNLVVADLLVCCFTITIEFGWGLTITWVAGDAACRILSFTKTLGLYVATFVVVAMSIDRCYAIWFPMRIGSGATPAQRARICLAIVWVAAVVCSIPQGVIFHVESHDDVPEFLQCVTFNYFESKNAEHGYVIFGILAMYVMPLITIIVVNAIILWSLRKSMLLLTAGGPKSHRTCTPACSLDLIQSDQDSQRTAFILDEEPGKCNSTSTGIALSIVRYHQNNSGQTLRLSTGLVLYHSSRLRRQRTRSRTLKLSLLIVCAFTICYTPYAIITLWAIAVDTNEKSIGEGVTQGFLMFTMCFSTIMALEKEKEKQKHSLVEKNPQDYGVIIGTLDSEERLGPKE